MDLLNLTELWSSTVSARVPLFTQPCHSRQYVHSSCIAGFAKLLVDNGEILILGVQTDQLSSLLVSPAMTY